MGARENEPRLADLADAVVGVVRQLRLPSDPAFVECTPVEISVMRVINRHPGASAREVSEATLLASSNFSRVLRGLEFKGLVSRDVDRCDARVVRLFPTERARESTEALRETWSETLGGIVDDPAELDLVVTTLRHIEDELISRRRTSRDQPGRLIERDLTARERA
jgi:MarR family transcriptional regulator, temperature-dependent positive regulator of motility